MRNDFNQWVLLVEWSFIRLLCRHLHYYLEGVLKVFGEGELTIRDKYSFDMLPLETETEWLELVDSLRQNAEKFPQDVESMPEAKLDEVFVKEAYGDYRRSIEGMIEHAYYHLGQISLIKKLI